MAASSIVWTTGSWCHWELTFSLRFSWLCLPLWVDFILTLGSLMEVTMAVTVLGFKYTHYAIHRKRCIPKKNTRLHCALTSPAITQSAHFEELKEWIAFFRLIHILNPWRQDRINGEYSEGKKRKQKLEENQDVTVAPWKSDFAWDLESNCLGSSCYFYNSLSCTRLRYLPKMGATEVTRMKAPWRQELCFA